MRSWTGALLCGLIIGVVFGAVNLAFAWFNPLEDDTPFVLLRFYGPMFSLWGLVAYRTVRGGRSFLAGVASGLVCAFGTFWVYSLFNALRVNLLLDQLTARADWQDMVMRFRASDAESLRAFVNADYFRGIPSKLGVAEVLGAVTGVCGSLAGSLRNLDQPSPPVNKSST